MSFDWLEFFSLAQALCSHPDIPGPSEAALRSAASRAYYAAFHSALSIAITEGFSRTYTGDDHSKVQAHFRNHKSVESVDQQCRKIATELRRLYDLRRQADYDDSLGRQPISLAAHAIGMAQRIIEKLDSMS